jgi:hypothetical protein
MMIRIRIVVLVVFWISAEVEEVWRVLSEKVV